MIIYGSSLSPFVRKLLVYCGERGIAFELKGIGLGSQDEGFLAASPLRKMPAIDDNGFGLSDSSAIIHYLEAKHDGAGGAGTIGGRLIPDDAQARGRVIWFEEYADTVMMVCGRAMFFNRVVSPRFLGTPGDAAAADKAEAEELPKICDFLEAALAAKGAGKAAYLVGDALSLADIAVASVLVNYGHAGAPIQREKHERLAQWFDAVTSRESFARWTAKEREILAA